MRSPACRAAGPRTCSTSSRRSRRPRASSGFAPTDARRLAYATFAGAVELAQASDAAPATLRAQVTSKGGTTERALAALEADAVKATDHRGGQAPRPSARASWATRSGGRMHRGARRCATGIRIDVDQALKFLLDIVFGLSRTRSCCASRCRGCARRFAIRSARRVIALTDWAVKPLRRVLPGYGGLDWASLLLAWLAQFLWLLALALLLGGCRARRHRRR